MAVKHISEFNTYKDKLDSHAGETDRSRLEADRRQYVKIEGKDSKIFSHRVYYPRIKRLANGKYLMFHQDGRISGNTFYNFSDDGLTWSERIPLFTSHKAVRDDGVEDTVFYCNTDGIVMPDGEVLAFCSYRYRAGYNIDARFCGIVMKRSSDNGETWTDEKLIYLGRNWESSPLLLQNGELQLYFSHTAPKFYYDKKVKTDAKIHTSSGSAIIRSFDGGHTWTPDVKEAPYCAHRVTQSYVETIETGTKCFTNQMPVAAELHCGDIALATESDIAKGRFFLTMSYSHDNWAHALDYDEDGPEDKNTAFDFGAGPYFVQLDSGETVLSYNTMDQFHLRLGDEYGKNLTAERDVIAFDGQPGYWGCLHVDSSHCVLAAMPYIIEDRTTSPWTSDNDMMLCRYYLNHRINARALDTKASDDSAWTGADALFLCAETDTQACFSFASSEKKLYLRIDRLDKTPDKTDAERVFIKAGERLIEIARKGNTVTLDGKEAEATVAYVTDADDPDNSKWGSSAVISLGELGVNELFVYAELEDAQTTAAFTGTSKDNTDTWFKVVID